MNRPTKLDWMIYRIFRWWWNPILRDDPTKTIALRDALNYWILEQILNNADEDGKWKRFEVSMMVKDE